jgi:hypothetical protein
MNAKWTIFNIVLIVVFVKIILIHVQIMIEQAGILWIFLPIIASVLLGTQVTLIAIRIFNSQEKR